MMNHKDHNDFSFVELVLTGL